MTSTYSSVITTTSSRTTPCCTSVNTTTTKPTTISPFFQNKRNISTFSNTGSLISISSVSDDQNNNEGNTERVLPEDKYDVGFYFGLSKNLSDSEIYDLILNCFVPDEKFAFPKNPTTKRAFQQKWLRDFDWLFYSVKFDGGFCLPSFLLRFQVQTDFNSAKVKKRNKAKSILPAIIDSVILCGHLGIPQRGHRDDKQSHPEAGEYVKTSCKRSVARRVRILLNASKSSHVKICHHNCFLSIKLVERK